MTAGGLASGTQQGSSRVPRRQPAARGCFSWPVLQAVARLSSCSRVPAFQLGFFIEPVSSGEKEHVLLFGVGHVRSTDTRGKLDGYQRTPSATTVKNQFIREDNPSVERDQRAWEPGPPPQSLAESS
jgi:hypothetical protein